MGLWKSCVSSEPEDERFYLHQLKERGFLLWTQQRLTLVFVEVISVVASVVGDSQMIRHTNLTLQKTKLKTLEPRGRGQILPTTRTQHSLICEWITQVIHWIDSAHWIHTQIRSQIIFSDFFQGHKCGFSISVFCFAFEACCLSWGNPSSWENKYFMRWRFCMLTETVTWSQRSPKQSWSPRQQTVPPAVWRSWWSSGSCSPPSACFSHHEPMDKVLISSFWISS